MAKVYSVNNSPATGPEAVFIVLTTLVAAGWVVQRSGDGLALYDSAGNVIVTGAAGAGGLGQVNAWFEIRDPNSRVCFTFQRITNLNWRVKYSESGAFAGGTPGISRTGSATDEQVLYGAGTDAAPTGTQMLHADNTYQFHVVADDDAQAGNNTYGVWFGCTVNGTGLCTALFALDGMLPGTYNTLDQAPRALITYAAPVGASTTLYNNNNPVGLATRAWVLYGLPGVSFEKFAIALYQLSLQASSNVGVGALGAHFFGSDPYQAKDQPMPALYARPSVFGGISGPKGFSTKIKVATAGRSYPHTIDNATDAYVYFGGLLLPWPENVAASL